MQAGMNDSDHRDQQTEQGPHGSDFQALLGDLKLVSPSVTEG